MSALLTRQVCERAWEVVSLAVDCASDVGIVNKMAGTIVVLDPTMPYNPSTKISSVAIFMEHLSPTYPDMQKYSEYAQAKAMLSWRTGYSSRYIQQDAPHLYKAPFNGEPGDIKWGGSVVRDGLVVAFSGVQPEFDEWIADTMAGLLIALCRREMTRPRDGIMAADSSYVVGLPQAMPGLIR
jgi:hypothetical protein